MRKNLTKKLFLSVLTLAFAVISLGASTYAWFVLSNEATVQPFTGTVTSASGIEIGITNYNDSTAPSEWFTGLLKTADIEDFAAFEFDSFSDVTSPDGKTFKDINGTEITKAAKKSFVAFNLWFRAPEECTVNLTEINFATTGASQKTIDQSFKLSTGKTVNLNDQIEFKVEDAIRVSFVANGTTVKGIYQNNAASDEITVAEGVQTGYAGNSVGFDTEFGAHQYYEKKTNTELEAQSEPSGVKQIDAINDDELLSLVANEAQYVTVYVWVEGFDGECINYIFSQVLAVDFKFGLPTE